VEDYLKCVVEPKFAVTLTAETIRDHPAEHVPAALMTVVQVTLKGTEAAAAQIYLARSLVLELVGDQGDDGLSSIDTTQGPYGLTVDDVKFAPGYECVGPS
jgi:hypothetical protein